MSIRAASIVLFAAAGALPLVGCDKAAKPPGPITVKVPQAHLNTEQQQRRDRTRTIVESKAIPFNQFLPGMELESDLKIRTPVEIARRIIALTAISAFAQGVPKERIEARLKQLDLRTVLSPSELAFYDSNSPSDAERRRFSWSIEGAAVLLWAVGLGASELPPPDKECDVPAIADLIAKSGLDGLAAAARVRSSREMLDSLDLHYCYHWAVVDEVQIHNRPSPGGLIPGITFERLRALNWLTHYMDADWDDVSTDT